MEIFFYFFVKIVFDLLGFYLIIFFGNKYIVFLIDIYLSWLEVLKFIEFWMIYFFDMDVFYNF